MDEGGKARFALLRVEKSKTKAKLPVTRQNQRVIHDHIYTPGLFKKEGCGGGGFHLLRV